jgi:diketogulonate reductase-like aldo/keto reductase
VLQAYSPLARGTRINDPTVATISNRHGKSPAQVLLRFGLQKGWVTLVKSQTPSRIRENIDIFDFKLTEDDMATLNSLDQGRAGAQFPANIR